MAVRGNLRFPEELNWVLWIIAGSDWPPGLEGDVWKIAEALDEAADDLEGVVDGLVAALNEVTRNVDETVGRAFWRYGEKLAEQPAFYAGGARDLAAMARDYSLNIQAAKLSIIVQCVFAGTEITRMWADPFEWPLIGPFIGMMRGIIELIFARLGQAISKALQTVIKVGSGFAGKQFDSAAVATGTGIAGAVVAGMAKQAIDEGLEEVFEDGIVQTWQKFESDKEWDWKDTLNSFKYGAAAGAFADALGSAMKHLKPGWQGKALTAGAIEMLTEGFVGAITVPEGGDPGDIWKGMLNGAVMGTGERALHNWKHSRQGGFKGEKLAAPGRPNVDVSPPDTSAVPGGDAGADSQFDGAGVPPPGPLSQDSPSGATSPGADGTAHGAPNGTTTNRPGGGGSNLGGGTAGRGTETSSGVGDSGANAPGSGVSGDQPGAPKSGDPGTSGGADTGSAGPTAPARPHHLSPEVPSAAPPPLVPETTSSAGPAPAAPAAPAPAGTSEAPSSAGSSPANSAGTNTTSAPKPDSAVGPPVPSQNAQPSPGAMAADTGSPGPVPPSTAVEAPDLSSNAPLAGDSSTLSTPQSAGSPTPNAETTTAPPSPAAT
ncbi:hypothetical protein ABZ790_16320, partial [Saccharopolyspora shandongensis]